MTGTKVYNAWRAMKQRTTWESGREYAHYGGRGIYVCEEWMNSFEAFYAYVGEPPSPKHSIDRIEVNKGYEPGNVRWATDEEQAINKRDFGKNKTGARLVYKSKDTYYVLIVRKGIKYYDGPYKAVEEAVKARDLLLARLSE